AFPPRGVIEVLHLPATVSPTPGHPETANARSVLGVLERACDGCMAGEFAAMVTAPVQKSAIVEAGIPFSGHTEFLADHTRTPRVVMMLVGGDPASRPAEHTSALQSPYDLVRRLVPEQKHGGARSHPRGARRPAWL